MLLDQEKTFKQYLSPLSSAHLKPKESFLAPPVPRRDASTPAFLAHCLIMSPIMLREPTNIWIFRYSQTVCTNSPCSHRQLAPRGEGSAERHIVIPWWGNVALFFLGGGGSRTGQQIRFLSAAGPEGKLLSSPTPPAKGRGAGVSSPQQIKLGRRKKGSAKFMITPPPLLERNAPPFLQWSDPKQVQFFSPPHAQRRGEWEGKVPLPLPSAASAV